MNLTGPEPLLEELTDMDTRRVQTSTLNWPFLLGARQLTIKHGSQIITQTDRDKK